MEFYSGENKSGFYEHIVREIILLRFDAKTAFFFEIETRFLCTLLDNMVTIENVA